MATPDDSIEILVSFDTTGSMYPCLTQVRRVVQDMAKRLFAEIPNLRMGVISHGDYCDGKNVLSKHELSTNVSSICKFVQTAPATGGGDCPECYELVLHEARSFKWTHGKSKVLVLIGDDVPHEPDYPDNKKRLDWRNEIANLRTMGVQVYGVQALNRRHATKFYREIASGTDGLHLNLDQFANVIELIFAICFKQAGPDHLQSYEDEVVRTKRMNRNLDEVFQTLSGRKGSKSRFASDGKLHPVPSGRFQVLSVDKDMPIKDFCKEQGVDFKPGRGFYELTKPVTVQGTKEIVLMSRATGDLFTGTHAREMLGLPLHDEDVKLKPTHLDEYVPFIQSTSNNRKLIGKTRLLYEVPDFDRAVA